MRVVDTSAWLEWITDTSTGQTLRPHVPPPDALVLPTIVQFELAKWLAREAPDRMTEAIGFTGLCIVRPLDSEIALSAAAIAAEYRLATADAIIYATALAQDADILTCDAHFEGLPHVLYVPKAPL